MTHHNPELNIRPTHTLERYWVTSGEQRSKRRFQAGFHPHPLVDNLGASAETRTRNLAKVNISDRFADDDWCQLFFCFHGLLIYLLSKTFQLRLARRLFIIRRALLPESVHTCSPQLMFTIPEALPGRRSSSLGQPRVTWFQQRAVSEFHGQLQSPVVLILNCRPSKSLPTIGM